MVDWVLEAIAEAKVKKKLPNVTPHPLSILHFFTLSLTQRSPTVSAVCSPTRSPLSYRSWTILLIEH